MFINVLDAKSLLRRIPGSSIKKGKGNDTFLWKEKKQQEKTMAYKNSLQN